VKWLNLAAGGVLAAACVFSQGGSPQDTPAVSVISPRETAAKREAEWESLAKGLDAKIARLLPCDPRAKSAIEEVSRASEARLAALSEALKVALVQAQADTERVRLTLTAEDETLRAAEVERADSEQEQVAIDGQLADLTASAKGREDLEGARRKLAQIATFAAARTKVAEEQIQARTTLDISLRDLLETYRARQAALENEQAALAVETSRWSEYYVERLGRAQMECSVTGSSPSSRQRKKE
jgi:hypothetical protein